MTSGFEGCCIPPSRVARLLKPGWLRPPRALLPFFSIQNGRISALRPAKSFLCGPLVHDLVYHEVMNMVNIHEAKSRLSFCAELRPVRRS